RKGLNNIRYAVEHLEVFKKPSVLASLPSTVYGHSVCALHTANEGEEYLLAGGFRDGLLTTSFCGQVRPNVDGVWAPVLDWR
ncbi:hypothetical protein PENTCL1PPCAC_657, partial [Pristionchus entomophagus]